MTPSDGFVGEGRSFGLLALLVVIQVSLVPGCSGVTRGPEAPSDSYQEVSSDKSRNLAPDATAENLEELVAGNTRFALALWERISGEPGNLFCSPYSISLALAMTYAGARGETETQVAGTLRFTLPQQRLHGALNALDLSLTGGSSAGQGDFTLKIANSPWGQTGYRFESAYLDTLAVNYGAGLRLVDFTVDPERCRALINAWVSDNTEEKIKDLLPPGSVDGLTRLVLTNAIYFYADWLKPFRPESTSPGTFHRPGSDVCVDMMEQTSHFGYANGDDYQAVELPYKGGRMSMLIILPESGQLPSVQERLDPPMLSNVADNLVPAYTHLRMPKFAFECKLGLGTVLSGMGMPLAFAADADFSGINGSAEPLFLKDVLHKAIVRVDEKGTEAAAATAVVIGTTSLPPKPVDFIVDRPFLFLIRDTDTGTILFAGRVVDPAAGP